VLHKIQILHPSLEQDETLSLTYHLATDIA